MRHNGVPGRHPGAASFWVSVRFAWQGIVYAFENERNFRIDLVLLAGTALLAVLLRFDLDHWALLVLCWGLVLGAELMNSALEVMVDLVQPDYHRLAAIAKDCAAGAVVLTAIVAALVGLLLFMPPLYQLIVQILSA